jgi:hypothetical protein
MAECKRDLWQTPRKRILVAYGRVTPEAKGLNLLAQAKVQVAGHQATVAIPDVIGVML